MSPELMELPPGADVELTLTIVNDGEEPLAPTLTVTGIDPDHVGLPDDLAVLAPGGSAIAVVRIHLPDDLAPGDRRLGFSVSDQDGLQREVVVTSMVRVGERPDVSLALDPEVSRGRRSASLDTQLSNRSDEPIQVRLTAYAEELAVGFLIDEVDLAPGEDLAVPTRVEPLHRSWFREVRHGARIEVQGRGVPVAIPATFVQQPLLPAWLVKTVAIVTVLAMWATLVVVAADRFVDDGAETKLLLASPELRERLAAGANGTGDTATTVGDDGVGGPPSVIQGSVSGPSDPAGTQVVVERVGFGDEGTTNGGVVLLAAHTSILDPVGAILDRVETSTDERGAFRLSSGLQRPAFYRVTALRPGFEVGSQVINLTEETPEIDVDLELVPASGAMSGQVSTDTGAALGGADITITDGALVYSTSAATETSVGSWSVGGLATPATYQVIVSAPGFATETLIVDLDGGEQATGVNATLSGGLGTIRGRATSEGQGVGGIRVEVEGEGLERATTTLTDGGLAGSFDLPALPFGTYQLTFSGEGWLTQTTQVTVDRGDVEVSVSDLRRSTGSIGGIVEQQVVGGSACRYPDPDVPGERDRVSFQRCGGVGITAIGSEREWRTTTTTGDGGFQLSGLPADEYLVRVERFGYASQFFEVELGAGDRLRLPADGGRLSGSAGGGGGGDVIRLALTPVEDPAAATVQGVIRDSTDPGTTLTPPSGTRVTIDDGVETLVGEVGADGIFRIERVRAGAHPLRITAPGFDVFSQIVSVPFGETTDAGVLPITPLGSLALRITGGQAAVVAGAEVFVTPDPVAYAGTQRTPPIVEAAGGTRECRRTIRLDDRPQTLDGLCASTDAVGDVEFRRSFGTGNYVLATPVNVDDLADVPARRATTVPLDHEQLVRRVDISSGGTVRLDPNLRRFPTISGAIRAPSTIDEGLDDINVTRDAITFRRIDAEGREIPLPPGAPTPRISASSDDGTTLGRGRYRIDRIPADDTEEQYSWELIIETAVGIFERGPGQREGFEQIDGLNFNDSVTINAILQPPPLELRFDVVYEDASGDDVPVPGALLRLRGPSGFEQLEQAPFFRPTATTCPGGGVTNPVTGVVGDDCLVPGEFDFTAADGDRVVTGPTPVFLTGDPLWLAVDAAGRFTMPAFFRPGELRLEVTAPGFERIDGDDARSTIDLEAPAPDADGTVPAFVEETIRMDVLPRDIEGTLRLRPPGTSPYPDFLDAIDPTVDLADDGDLFATLDATLGPVGGPATALAIGADGSFSRDAQLPGTYELTVDGDFTEPFSATFVVAPDDGPYVVADSAATVTRRGYLEAQAIERTIEVATDDTETITDVPLPGVTVQLQRQTTPGAFVDVGDPLTTCADPGDADGGPGCSTGTAVFDDIRIFSDAGTPFVYRLVSSLDGGYLDRVGAPFTLGVDPYPVRAFTQDRYAEVFGRVRGQIGNRAPQTLPKATVTLRDRDDAVVAVAVTCRDPAPTDEDDSTDPDCVGPGAFADGDFAFGVALELEPGDGPYTLTFEADGHLPSGPIPFQGAVNTRVERDIVLEALPASLGGAVTASDPDADIQLFRSFSPFGAPEGVDVQITLESLDVSGEGGSTNSRASVTLPGGTVVAPGYLFAGINAGSYRLIAEPDPADPADDLLGTLELEIDLTPGEARRFDVRLPFADANLRGTVRTDAFRRVTPPSTADLDGLDGVTVTATRSDGELDPFSPYVTQTDGDGGYEFFDVAPGTYTLTFERDGYETATVAGVLVASPFAPSGGLPPTIVDRVVYPALIDVDVDVVSSFDDAPVPGATVEAVYLGPETGSPPAPPADAPFLVDLGGDGSSASYSLPPGCWGFSVRGIDGLDQDPRPYVPITVADVRDGPGCPLDLPLATEGADLPDDPFEVAIDPYARIDGTVVLDTGDDTDDVAITIEDADGTDVTDASGALIDTRTIDAGTWTVWLPEVSADETRVLRFTLDGFAADPVPIPRPGDDPGDFIADTDTRGFTAEVGEVELAAQARNVEVLLTSRAGDATLDDLELTATLDGRTVEATVEFDGTDAIATFTDLEPSQDWLVATVDSAELDVPHEPVSGVSLEVEAGGPRIQPPKGVLIDWAATVTGTVTGRDFAGAVAQPLAGATATVVRGGTTLDARSIQAVGATDARWRVGLRAVGTGTTSNGTVSVSAPGYGTAPTRTFGATGGVDAPFNDGAANLGTTQLTALPQDVTVAVSSLDGNVTDLEGVEVTASWAGTSTGPSLTTSELERTLDVTADPATATFTLPPGSWSFTTSGGPDLDVPHLDAATTSPLVVAVDDDPPTTTVDSPAVDLTMQRYAAISGTVAGADFAGGATTPLTVEDDGVTITVDGAGTAVVDATPPNAATGGYRVWLADPNAGTITIDATGYDADTITIAELTAPEPCDDADDDCEEPTPLTVGGDAEQDVTLVATPRSVTVALTALGANGEATDGTDADLAGVTVTATWEGEDGDPAPTAPDDVSASLADGDVTASFALPPGPWSLATTDADERTVPHTDDESDTVEVLLDDGTDATEPADPVTTLELQRYAAIELELATRFYPDGEQSSLDEELLADVDVEVLGAGASVTRRAVTGGRSTVTVWLADPDQGTITLELDGYAEVDPIDIGALTAPQPCDEVADPECEGDEPPLLVLGGSVDPTEAAAAIDATVLARVFIATPRSLTVTVVDSEGDEPQPVDGATVTATVTGPSGFEPPEPDAAETDGNGRVMFPSLAPGGTWLITASLGDETDSESVLIEVGLDPEEITLVLEDNSKLFGTVFEVRGDDRVALPGVTVRAQRDGETFQTRTTEADAAGENYALQARAGTWRISTVRSGTSTVIDEAFEIRRDGPDSDRNVLDIQLPTTVIDLAGRVLDDDGRAVPGAAITATSTVGTVTTTSDGDGGYTLAELDNRVTWAVTFSPPAGFDGRPVTRYVALSGELTATIALDQTLPSALGRMEINLDGGEPGLRATVTLTETGPFPTVGPDGRLERTVTLDALGAASLAFEDLVPGDGRSIGQDRFGLRIAVEGRDEITRSGLDVTPGGTTTVDIDLGMVDLTRRVVELTLRDAQGPMTTASVRLQRDGEVLGPPTSPPDSDRYTFAGVRPDTWQVVAEGYAPVAIDVPAGVEPFTATLTLVALPDEEDDDATAPDPDGPPVSDRFADWDDIEPWGDPPATDGEEEDGPDPPADDPAPTDGDGAPAPEDDRRDRSGGADEVVEPDESQDAPAAPSSTNGSSGNGPSE